MVIESQKMLLRYVSSLAPHFFVGPDVAPHFLHARNTTAFSNMFYCIYPEHHSLTACVCGYDSASLIMFLYLLCSIIQSVVVM